MDVLAELGAEAAEFAPKVFALCESGEVVFWGVAHADYAEVVSVSGDARGSFGSAESAHRMFSRARDVDLVWM